MLDRNRDHLASGRSVATLRSDLAGIAASAGSVERRATDLLRCLGQAVPLAAACIAVRDAETDVHRMVGRTGSTEPVADYLERAEAESEIEFLGLDQPGPPVHAAKMPVPLEETLVWSEHLLPAGFVDGFALSLYSGDGRQVGLAAFLTDVTPERMGAHSALVDQVRPYLARALDRLPSLAALAELSGDTLGGVALTRAGRTVPLPGLPGHPLLAADSPVLAYARAQLSASGTRATFLAPFGSQLLRISALDCREPTADHLQSVVLVHPAGELHGLRSTDLKQLGARLEGWSDRRISEHMRAPHERLKPSPGDLDDLLLLAGREGLFIPPALW